MPVLTLVDNGVNVSGLY